MGREIWAPTLIKKSSVEVLHLETAMPRAEGPPACRFERAVPPVLGDQGLGIFFDEQNMGPGTLKFFDKKNMARLSLRLGRSVQPSGRIYQSKAKSQRIAAWELLYRVQHPGRYVSRLQTILHSDIAVQVPRHEDDHPNT